jgi:hypothetical protein
VSVAIQDILEQLKGMDPAHLNALNKEVMEATGYKKWVANIGPQLQALRTDADELFYGGQAGGGKTDLVMGLALTEHQNSLILRRTNKEAEKLPVRLEEILGHNDGLNRSTGTWRVEDRIIDMGGCQLESDKQKRKGIPHDLKAFDEIADFSETQYKFIIAWNRSTNPNQRCRVVCTGNPPTTAEGFWVIKHWAAWLDPTHPNPAKDGELRWYTTDMVTGKEIEVDGPGPHLINGEEIMARSRTFIRSTLDDNPDLAMTNYDAVLAALPERERLAYREGRFDASLQDQIGQTIPTAWIRAAQDRWEPNPPEHIPMCAIAADMTGGGRDPMLISKRHDLWFSEFVEHPGSEFNEDTMGAQGAGNILAQRRDGALVVIDLGGGYGSSCFEHLRENDLEVIGHKGMEGSTRKTRDTGMGFFNKRSEIIWGMRELLDPSQPGGSRIQLPNDPEMVADLTAPTYQIINRSIIKVEPKEHVVERLGRSTNRGDAICMCANYGPTHETAALEWIERKEAHRKRGQTPKVITSRPPLTARRR